MCRAYTVISVFQTIKHDRYYYGENLNTFATNQYRLVYIEFVPVLNPCRYTRPVPRCPEKSICSYSPLFNGKFFFILR